MEDLREQIRLKLQRITDGNEFEEYVSYSLGKIIAGLSPVSGGGDFGRDGEVPTEKGAAPLTCTIQANVIGNMSHTLDRNRESGGKATIAFVATNQKLSNTQKQNLRTRAKEKGFTLAGIYDEDYFVDALFKDAEWRMRLLGISGELPALSKVPITTRKTLDVPIIGRDKTVVKIEGLKSDLLISGQPGSGKTYIATNFVDKHNAYFVISDDLTKIANELRSKTPEHLVIDDIHNKTDLLAKLQHLRTELGLSFKIIGISWSSVEKEIKLAMGLGDDNIVRLAELTRDEIVQVIDACGLKGAGVELKREIVNQSKGKPGLAITLSDLCLQGDWAKVFNGDSLYDFVRYSFNQRLGRDVTTLLSFVALGGDSGITLENVSKASGISISDVKTILDELSVGGVISSREDGTVRIEPNSLRYPLVRGLFLEAGSGTLKFEDYIPQYKNLNDVVQTLLITALKGAHLDSSRLLPYLSGVTSPETWSYYGAMGESEAEYVASNNRDAIIKVPGPILYRQPKVAIRELIQQATNDRRQLNQYPDHPIRILSSWAEGERPGNNVAVKHRKLLLETITSMVKAGYDDELTISRIIAAALNPNYQANETDAGVGKTITFMQGYLTSSELELMKQVIADAKQVYSGLKTNKAFSELVSIAGDWVYNRQVTSEEYLTSISVQKLARAKEFVNDLHGTLNNNPLLQRKVRKLGLEIGLDLTTTTPMEYEILFPYESRSSRREEALYKKQMDAVKVLAEEWSKLDANKVAQRVSELQTESNETGTTHPNYLHHFPAMIARLIKKENLIDWTLAFSHYAKSYNLTSEFAIQVAKLKPDGYRETLKKLAADDVHASAAVEAIVTQLKVSEEPLLFEIIAPLLSKHSRALDVYCLRGEISLENELFLLDNVDEDAAVEICGGIAYEYKEKATEMPDELKSKWQAALINHSTKGYQIIDDLTHILKENPAVIKLWFENKINTDISEENGWNLHIDDIATNLIDKLSEEDKVTLIESMNSSDGNYSLVQTLVGQEPKLYQALINNKNAKKLHLRPLTIFSEEWVEMAQMALEAGYSSEQIKKASYHFDFGWTDSEVDMWQDRLKEVENHKSQTDSKELLSIIDESVNNIKASMETAEEKERSYEVNGY